MIDFASLSLSEHLRPGQARLVSVLSPFLATHPRNAFVTPLPAALTKNTEGILPDSLSSRNGTRRWPPPVAVSGFILQQFLITRFAALFHRLLS